VLMVRPADDHRMFVCDCHHCGRRELRGPRSLRHRPAGWYAHCRACGAENLVAGDRAPVASPQAA
jgi:hypothetical protein